MYLQQYVGVPASRKWASAKLLSWPRCLRAIHRYSWSRERLSARCVFSRTWGWRNACVNFVRATSRQCATFCFSPYAGNRFHGQATSGSPLYLVTQPVDVLSAAGWFWIRPRTQCKCTKLRFSSGKPLPCPRASQERLTARSAFNSMLVWVGGETACLNCVRAVQAREIHARAPGVTQRATAK